MTAISLQEAIHCALLNSLVKYNQNFEWVHAPMALAPFEIPQPVHNQIMELTPLFNQLMLHVALDHEFLKESLAQASQTDPFLQELLAIHQETKTAQPLQLLINRNDYMFTQAADGSGWIPKQVELNTISVSYPFLISRLAQVHQFLFRNEEWGGRLVENDPIRGIVSVMAEAIQRYDHPKACLLTLVQPQEQNIFDQLGGEYQLWAHHRIPTLRMTLEELGREGSLREGHLVVRGHVVAMAYFRAGYTPEDYPSKDAWKARRLLEASSTIDVPSTAMQLAGMKKIQQVLTTPTTLRKFVAAPVASQIEATFAGLYLLDEPIEKNGWCDSAAQMACRFPHEYVLKPQREGGGNNFYDQEMVMRLQSMKAEERPAYVLMERIQAVQHATVLLTEGQARQGLGVSEVGRFGVCLAEGRTLLINQDVGYLVRTKAADENEGGVSAGYSCLNTLCLAPSV